MENFKYQDESDMPRDTYIGLKMQIGSVEKSIRYTKINLNKAKYFYEKRKYEKRLEYLTNLLDIYKNELDKIDKTENNLKINENNNVTLEEGYVLKGMQDGKSFDISYNENENKLQKLKDELQQSHTDVDMYIVKENKIYENSLKKNHKFIELHKLEEVSRNELLVKTKGETIDRYNKAAGYRGFSIYNIDTSNILRYNSLVVICRVGKYNTAVELEEILYWIQIVAENTKSSTKNQVNTKVVTQAIMNSIDGLNIRVDCECGDWKYRMAYQATQWGYKYGTPENRPANIRNPEGRGALCKHLTSILGNKRWLQQVTSTLLNWLEANIDEVNRFLGLSGDRVLTLPNELARQNAKLSWQNRRKGDSDDDTTNQDNSENNENQDNNTNNVQGNNPSTNAINNAGSVEEQTDETEQEDNEG